MEQVIERGAQSGNLLFSPGRKPSTASCAAAAGHMPRADCAHGLWRNTTPPPPSWHLYVAPNAGPAIRHNPSTTHPLMATPSP